MNNTHVLLTARQELVRQKQQRKQNKSTTTSRQINKNNKQQQQHVDNNTNQPCGLSQHFDNESTTSWQQVNNKV